MTLGTPARIVQPAIVLLGVIACIVLGRTSHSAAGPVAPTSIAQVPLTVANPAHPQIVIAVGNSESMDGNLSGAIMTGSGSLSPVLALLQNSSSPLNFTIPAGFTPPLNPGAGGMAPYTVTANGLLVDNSPSRLNVAKQGIAAVLNAFLPDADFALLDYVLSGTAVYTTWLYEMSPTTGPFVFSNSTTPAPDRWVANPCYQYHTLGNGALLWNECHAIDISNKVTGNMDQAQFMQISASSDDPLINDVLYAGAGIDAVCLDYGGPNPASPYLAYTLAQYNAAPSSIAESYSIEVNNCPPTTFPTNAGYVPFTPQTLYVQRGFGYGGGQSSSTANTLVPMTSAGANPTPASVAAAVAKFMPYLAPETNSAGTTEIKAAGGQSALPGLLRGAGLYYKSANPSSTNGCAAQRYVVLLTDGLPTLDLSGASWPPPGTVSAQQWGMTVAFNPDGSLDTSGNTNDQAVLDTVSALTQLKAAGINTYVIGLGAGVDPSVNPVAAQVLTAFAIAGGTGSYFAAANPAALSNQLQVVVAKIIAATQSVASTGVNSTGLHNGSVAYLAQFTTSDTFQDWTGNLNAWNIDPATGQVNTTPGSQVWSAQTQLDAQAANARLIATWDPVAKAGTPFRWNPPLAPAGISATTALGMALASFPADTNGQDVLQFIRGSSAQEQRNGGPFRNRTHKLGDIVFSAPLYVGAPSGLTQTTDYFAFVTANAKRSPLVYIGANDGMLHAFDAATGAERFAYIPNGVFNNLVKLANPFYNQQHQYFVNGSPRVADVKFASDGSWHTVLVGTEGAGGSTLFALDVSAPDSLVTEAQVAQAVLWEFTDADMGLSFSEPEIVTTAAGWMVVVGNGYNSPNQKPVLYGINPQTGALLAKVDLCAAVPAVCNTAVANGLSSVAVVNNYGQVSGASNVVYAGDLQGNVWRVDISAANPANWIVSVMFQTTDPSGVPQPITTVPAVTLNPKFPNLLGTMVYVGTGQLLGVPDLSTTQIETMYGIYDPPTGATPPIGFAGIPNRTNLQAQVLAQESVNGTSVRTVPTPSVVPLPPAAGAVRGWYMDLSLSPGERVIADPEIESGGGVVFTTYQPNASTCSGGGNAWLMVLNFATGAAFPLPELDVSGDGKINQNDVPASGNVPVGMLLGSVYASTPTLLPGGGTGGTSKLTSLSSGTVASVLDRRGGKQRISWWEIRQ
ncbi:MAG: pilus assembly protein PilY [Gammaproteobacteria bacterium]|nr:pilus assembly protein PilY [Gammaproteobacteria bacterium]